MLLSDPAAYSTSVPHEEFARLRREEPVSWVPEAPRWHHGAAGGRELTGSGFWALTRYRTVSAASRDTDRFSSAARGAFLSDPKSPRDLDRTRQLLLNMDAPQHTAIRAVVNRAFQPAALERLVSSVRGHARSLVSGLLERDQFDVVTDLAAELPLLVLTDLLGVPREDRHLMFEWSNDIVGFDDPDYGGGSVDRYQTAFAEAFRYACDLRARKRSLPGDDLVSELARSEIDGRPMTESEFCHLWILLVIGGNESTRHFLSGSLQTLAECPRQRQLLIDDAGRIPTAVEELLRWVSPIMQFRRTATCDTELEGRKIREGDKVVLYYVSANRDDEVFPSGDRLDLTRSPNPHLAFGVGPHFCLGAHLLRLEAVALLESLRPHLAALELTGAAVRLESNFMNGLKSLPARFALARTKH